MSVWHALISDIHADVRNLNIYNVTMLCTKGASYISIVRDPVRRFASAFAYYSVAGTVNKWLRNHPDTEEAKTLPQLPMRDLTGAMTAFAKVRAHHYCANPNTKKSYTHYCGAQLLPPTPAALPNQRHAPHALRSAVMLLMRHRC